MRNKKKRFNIFDWWFLNQTWSKRFFASHMFGWIVASLQTIWIVLEIKRATIQILQAMVGENENE
jgi:hypothetical protein